MPKKKTTRPEMSWVEGRNQWRKRVILGDRSRDVYGATKDEVRAKVRELEDKERAGQLNDNTTLSDYIDRWYPIRTAGLRHNSVEVYKNVINNHIAPFFAGIKVSDIRPLHVQRLLADKAGLSHSLQAKILFTLSGILDSAEQNGMIAKNPCRGIRAGGAKPAEKEPLTSAQQTELVAAVAGTRAELFVLLCLYAGLRREEALGLLWSDVHLGATPYIDVRHTVTFANSRPEHSDDLKSAAAYRSIPVPLPLEIALSAARLKTDSMFVVPAVRSGAAMSLVAFRRMWEIASGSVPFHIHPHLLRHTYLTELCAGGLDIKKIQYLAGHEDVAMTLGIYTHVKKHNPKALSESINNIFSGSTSGSTTK